jgi:hypothetical protein
VTAVAAIAPLVLCRACLGGWFEDADGAISCCMTCKGTGVDQSSYDGCLCGGEHEPEEVSTSLRRTSPLLVARPRGRSLDERLLHTQVVVRSPSGPPSRFSSSQEPAW